MRKRLNRKNFGSSKKCRIFAPSLQETFLLVYAGVAVLFATNTAINAAQNRLSNPYRFAALHKSVNVSCRTGGDSLSYIGTSIFHSVMQETMKDYNNAKPVYKKSQ
jgi:hypothetical protein